MFLFATLAMVLGMAANQGRSIPEHFARHWFTVDNQVIRPGEKVMVTWWVEFRPGVKDGILYDPSGNQGYPATVLFFENASGDITVNSDIPGKLLTGMLNPEMCGWGQLAGTVVGNTIALAAPSNYYNGCNPKPTTKNPLWLLKFWWIPQAYVKGSATFSMQMSATSRVAVEVPSLKKYFPTHAYMFFTAIPPPPIDVIVTDEVCIADCDKNDSLDIDDFVCYQTLYAIGDPKADCDSDGKLLIDDFICFQTAYAIGC